MTNAKCRMPNGIGLGCVWAPSPARWKLIFLCQTLGRWDDKPNWTGIEGINNVATQKKSRTQIEEGNWTLVVCTYFLNVARTTSAVGSCLLIGRSLAYFMILLLFRFYNWPQRILTCLDVVMYLPRIVNHNACALCVCVCLCVGS